MPSLDRHRQRKQLDRFRESRRRWIRCVSSVPIAISSFIGLVASCSTGVWSEPPTPSSLTEVLLSLAAVTRVVSAAGLLLVLFAMYRLASRWWLEFWRRLVQRRR